MTDETVNTDDSFDDDETAPSGKKKFLIMGVAALLLIGGGAGAYFFLAPSDEGTGGENEAAEKIAVPEPVVFFSMPEVTVNLESVAGRQQYLKLKTTLELRSQADIDAIEPYMPRVLDAFQVYLRELRTTDLEGSAGMFRLKEELQRRINTAVYPVEVRKVLFEEILIQ